MLSLSTRSCGSCTSISPPALQPNLAVGEKALTESDHRWGDKDTSSDRDPKPRAAEKPGGIGSCIHTCGGLCSPERWILRSRVGKL
eukprot:3103702-Amphidinium_carterae.1